MKKVMIAIVVVCILTVPALAQGTMKIGIFDPVRISEETAAGQQTQEALKSFLEAKQKDLAEKEQELQALQEQAQGSSLSLSQDKLAEIDKTLQLKALDLNAARESAQREWQLERNEAQSKFEQQLLAVINEFGKREGFDLLLDRSAVAYAAPGTDVTTGLVDLFNSLVTTEPKSE